ncbi:coil containing protein [Vibrio phage 2.096.O._10N.286.48.B5]|nr:coil containing protein [Vibrio phage 2.096.O._10N.286.48.B5]
MSETISMKLAREITDSFGGGVDLNASVKVLLREFNKTKGVLPAIEVLSDLLSVNELSPVDVLNTAIKELANNECPVTLIAGDPFSFNDYMRAGWTVGELVGAGKAHYNPMTVGAAVAPVPASCVPPEPLPPAPVHVMVNGEAVCPVYINGDWYFEYGVISNAVNKPVVTAINPITDQIVEFLTNNGRPVNKPHNLTYVVNELIAFTKVTLGKPAVDAPLAPAPAPAPMVDSKSPLAAHCAHYTPEKVTGLLNQWFYPIHDTQVQIGRCVKQLRKVNAECDKLRELRNDVERALSGACRTHRIDLSLSNAEMIKELSSRLKSAGEPTATGTVIQGENMIIESASDQWCQIYTIVHGSESGTVDKAVKAAQDFVNSIK